MVGFLRGNGARFVMALALLFATGGLIYANFWPEFSLSGIANPNRRGMFFRYAYGWPVHAVWTDGSNEFAAIWSGVGFRTYNAPEIDESAILLNVLTAIILFHFIVTFERIPWVNCTVWIKKQPVQRKDIAIYFSVATAILISLNSKWPGIFNCVESVQKFGVVLLAVGYVLWNNRSPYREIDEKGLPLQFHLSTLIAMQVTAVFVFFIRSEPIGFDNTTPPFAWAILLFGATGLQKVVLVWYVCERMIRLRSATSEVK